MEFKTKYLKNLFLKNWRLFTLIVAAIIFFIGTSAYNYTIQQEDYIKWLSPDETANYTFAKLYGQENTLTIFEKYNLVADGLIMPRSFRSDNGWLKPVSFLGIILIYGKIASVFSSHVLPYLTPLFASIGIIYFYLLLKKFFGRRNAYYSALLLSVFPVYIYYSARSMFHNVLFTVLLIAGLFHLSKILAHNKTKNIYLNSVHCFASGLFLGLAVITRVSELLWLAPIILIILLANIKRLNLLKITLFFAAFSTALMPMFYYNQILYDSPWNSGYPEMNQSIRNIYQASGNLAVDSISTNFTAVKSNFKIISQNIFHFGFKLKQSARTFYYYLPHMFPWLFTLGSLGLILFFQKISKWKKRHYLFIINYTFLSLVLIFYYGSWSFNDNPDPASFTIGNSYTRYWLPIYLGLLPFASMAIIKFTKFFKNKKIIIASRAIVFLLIAGFSISFVVFEKEEGLAISKKNQLNQRNELAKVLSLTENNSVIITQYHDKLLFPERKVVVGLFDDKNLISRYALLAEQLPVYYYNFTFPQKDIDYLNSKRLSEFGLHINPIEKITNSFTLYKIELNNNFFPVIPVDIR